MISKDPLVSHHHHLRIELAFLFPSLLRTNQTVSICWMGVIALWELFESPERRLEL